MPRGAELQPAIRRRSPARCRRPACENCARACSDVELGRGRPPCARVLAAAAERVGQRQQDAADFLCFLLLERDDVVVDFDGAERLEKEAGAAARTAVHDSGNRGAVFGSHDQHVASVAIGDDLLLQVFRRVLAAQIRFERAAQPRALLAQPIPQAPQLRARVVHHLAGRDRSCGGRRRSRVRTRPPLRDARAGSGTPRRAADRGAGRVDRGEKRGERQQLQRLRARVLRRASALEDRFEIRRSVERQSGCRRGIARSPTSRQARPPPPRLRLRLQQREARSPRRGLREAANRLDNAIELEGPQGASMHRA